MAGLFVGLATLDVLAYVDSMPERDEKITANLVWTGAGGPATNAAITYSRLGGSATLLSRFGAGYPALLAMADLKAEKVRAVDLYDSGDFPTSLAIVDRDGARSVVSVNATLSTSRPLHHSDLVGASDVLVFDRHALSTVSDTVDQVGSCIGRRIADLGTYGPESDVMFQLADVVVVPESGLPREARADAVAFIRSRGGTRFVVTRGGRSISVVDLDMVSEISPVEVDVVDTLGAGDVFIGALAWYYRPGDLLSAARSASMVASASVSHRTARIEHPL